MWRTLMIIRRCGRTFVMTAVHIRNQALTAADLTIDVADLAIDAAGWMVRSWPRPAACSQ